MGDEGIKNHRCAFLGYHSNRFSTHAIQKGAPHTTCIGAQAGDNMKAIDLMHKLANLLYTLPTLATLATLATHARTHTPYIF